MCWYCAPFQELAWASYALLRNTNASGLLVWHDGQLLAARGYLGAATGSGNKQQALEAMSAVSLRRPG